MEPEGKEQVKPKIDPLSIAFEPQVAPWRKELSNRMVRGWVRLCHFVARHWLWLANAVNFFFLSVAFLVPMAEEAGWSDLARPFFKFCSVVCVQNPAHSFYLNGHQMALCERCLAIYAVLGLLGLVFHLVRYRVRPIQFWQYCVLVAPMALDGFTQLFGWRESTWELRLVTGAFFGLASVWYMYPQLEVLMVQLKFWARRNLAQV
jgi:uncharacterized membrane protein